VEVLVAAVDELVAMDPHQLADGDALVELDHQLNRMMAVRARATAAWDAEQGWAPSGARTAGAWLAARTRVPVDDAKRVVRLGRALRVMPRTESAWLRGEINERHVARLAKARTPDTEDAFARDEAELVRTAGQSSFLSFNRRVHYWLQEHDEDGVERDAEAQRAARKVHLSQSFHGRWFGDLTLDPISGTIVSNALRSIEQQLFEADWAEARARLGQDPLTTDLRRTPAQRRSDALVEMATRAMSMPKGARRPKPLFTALVGYETMLGRICELANRSVVTPGSLAPYLTEADIERVVFGPDGRVIDVGEPRCFTGATRRAVQVAGLECFEDTCETPAEDCQIDHIVPYTAGGPTRTWNGRPACGYHNRQRSRGP
jgi:hypothetical protein